MTLFFMLSGFILAHRYVGRTFTDREFIVARFARIYPVYILSFVLALPMLWVQMTDLRYGVLSAVVQIAVIAVTAIAMVQAWAPMLFSYVNNNANWSLSVEAAFYGMFLLLVGRLSAMTTRSVVLLIVVLYGLSLLGPLSYYAFENRPTHGLQIFYAMPVFRLPEFLIGMMTYIAMKRCPKIGHDAGWFAFALLLVAVAYLGFAGRILPIYVGHNWIMIPLVAFSLIALSGSQPSPGRSVLGGGIMVYLGKISYGFYCFQFHVLMFIMFMMPDYKDAGRLFLLVSLTLLLILSALCFHFYEEPARRLLRRRYAHASAG